MDYEKKYKEALARAREIHISNDEMEYLFPELKEIEDEKIRKSIIEGLREMKSSFHTISSVKIDDAIAWLEKQGEKPQGKTALEAINEEKVDNANKVDNTNKNDLKFHIGDWIITNNTKITFLVKSFTCLYYTLEDTKGNIYSPCVAPTEEDYHLWSINDAKDGDVLQLGKVTAIFQNYISNKECRCYCSVFDGEFKIPVQYADTYGCHNAVPATKEQRDILMKAMADSGYTFDFERKELKKISKKPTNSIWHDNKCIPDNDDKEILVEYNLNNSTRPNHLFHDVAPYDSDSKMFHCYSMHLKLEEIIRWAYMDDILQVVNR